jgi:CBS domain containing-hemolysin-like protein
MDNYTFIIVSSILFSAFFAGTEIAFISSNKLLIELKSKQGSVTANILSNFVNNPSKFISTTLVGNNIGLVIYGIYMAKVLDPLLVNSLPYLETHRFLLLFAQTIISTLIVLVTAEFIPKVLFRINPDLVLQVLALPFLLFYYIFWPVVHIIIWLSKIILNGFLKIKYTETTPVFSKIDLDDYINQVSDNDLDDDVEVDTEMFKNALDFSNLKVRDCMTPRTDLEIIDITETPEVLYQKFVQTGLSKILVYGGTPDNIIGYVHQKEIFKKVNSIKEIVFPIEIVPATTSVMDVLNRFSKTRKSIALVVNELGGTAGIVTIEDVMEEIFGEIDDEHDTESLTEKVLADNEFLFSGRLEIHYLNNKYDLELPEGEYNTLGGFVTAHHEDIPQQGEKVVIDNFEITIQKSSSAKIDEVILKTIKA